MRRKLDVIPQQVNVIGYCTAAYTCEACEKESGYANIHSLQAQPQLLKHSLTSPSTVADVMVCKCVDGLPLYRRLKKHLLEGRVIYADETVVQALKADRGQEQKPVSGIWGILSAILAATIPQRLYFRPQTRPSTC